MRNRFWIFLILVFLIGSVIFEASPASAGNPAQIGYQTPTARPDGRVVYVVQEGDSCLRIELLTGTKIETLRTLNRLDQECTLIPGKELLLAVITPQPTATPNPDVTNTPLLPSPTPFNGNGNVCVILYEDVNGNATHDETEGALAGGAVSITDRLGQISKTENTQAGVDPVCIEIPEGEYNISMAIPSGYNSTTTLNLQNVKVQAGDQAIMEFGAQVSSVPKPEQAENPQPAEGDSTGFLLAVLGGLLVVMGIGLGVYIAVGRRG